MNTRGSWNAARIPLYDFFTDRPSHTKLDLYIKYYKYTFTAIQSSINDAQHARVN